jgi:hypothetical protein
MSERTPRNFPDESQQGPWPLLKPTKEDLIYMPAPKPLQAPQPNPPAQSQFLKLISPVLKGVILGTLVFGLVYSFLPLQTFWLSSFHWIYPIAGVVLLYLLVGPNITFAALWVVSLVIALWSNWNLITTAPVIPLIFVGGGIIVLYIRRLFPERT